MHMHIKLASLPFLLLIHCVAIRPVYVPDLEIWGKVFQVAHQSPVSQCKLHQVTIAGLW